MKRTLFASLLAALLAVSMLAGCTSNGSSSGSGSGSSGSSSTTETSSSSSAAADQLKEGVTMKEIVTKLNEEFGDWGIRMPGEITADMFKDMYYITDDIAEEYYGEATQIRPGVSCIFAVKAKDGQIDKVKEALEKTKSDMDTTVAYLPLDKEMLEAADVYVRGNYAFLMVIGDEEKLDDEQERAKEIVDSFFN